MKNCIYNPGPIHTPSPGSKCSGCREDFKDLAQDAFYAFKGILDQMSEEEQTDYLIDLFNNYDAVRRRPSAMAKRERIEELEAQLGLRGHQLTEAKKACEQWQKRLVVSRLLVKQLNRDIAQIRSDENSETADKE